MVGGWVGQACLHFERECPCPHAHIATPTRHARAGIGAPLSLALRCLGGRRQSVGELLAGVAAVQEVAVEASGDGDGDD